MRFMLVMIPGGYEEAAPETVADAAAVAEVRATADRHTRE
jgi:hypothetical protein